jgi:hypothetical protein
MNVSDSDVMTAADASREENDTETDGAGRISTLSTANTCHILPCNIDYTGMAPSHLYFHPVKLQDPKGMYASTFRGRGLLAKAEPSNTHPHQVKTQPVLLHVHHDQLNIKANIDNTLEWHHEHNPAALQYADQPSRWQRAQAWNELANAVGDVDSS